MNKLLAVVGGSFTGTFFAVRWGYFGRETLVIKETKDDLNRVWTDWHPFKHTLNIATYGRVSSTIHFVFDDESPCGPPATYTTYSSFKPIDYRVEPYEKNDELEAKISAFVDPICDKEGFGREARKRAYAGLQDLVKKFE